MVIDSSRSVADVARVIESVNHSWATANQALTIKKSGANSRFAGSAGIAEDTALVFSGYCLHQLRSR